MRILALNCAGEKTEVIYIENDKVFYQSSEEQNASVVLLPLVDEVLARANVKINDIDAFGACTGPGSFTGIRIAVSTVRGFCYALNKPAFSVNNLRLLSYNNRESKLTAAFSDAGNGILYCAVYDAGKEVTAPFCIKSSDANDFLSGYSEISVSCDTKTAHHFEKPKVGTGGAELERAVREAAVNTFGYDKLVPLYIRKPQPERESGDL